jgi:hypothetical protein
MLRKHQLVDPILELVPYHLKNSSCRTEVPILLQLKTRKNRNSVIKKINWQFPFCNFAVKNTFLVWFRYVTISVGPLYFH